MTATTLGGGPLQGLIRYYERLQNDPHESIADYGFSQEKIHFQVLLEKDGALADFEDIRETNERGKPIFRPLLVPDGGGRSGTSIKPFFCWDNTGYVLGRDNKGKPVRAEAMFAAFRDLHLSLERELAQDEGFSALCQFLKAWDPARAESLKNWEEAAGLNVVFKLRGATNYVHQSSAVREAWLERATSTQPEADAGEEKAKKQPTPLRGVSLIGGEQEELARLHPLLSGVSGANTMGAAIVSFNLDAFESYGKSQSYNAPVSVRDAFRYTTALNRLLSDNARRTRIGDATVVFWTDRADAKEAEELFAAFFSEAAPAKDAAPKGEPAEHGETKDHVRAFLDLAREGRLGERISNPQAPFYILGLSPNASRLNVRYWLTGTVEQFAQRLAKHEENLSIVGARDGDSPLGIRRLLMETAREPKDIQPQLAGEVARAILTGSPYPQSLFGAVVRRVRIDAEMNHRRAAIVKAYLIRNFKQEITVSLDKDHADEAYQLGRLFAVLDKTQEDATDGKLNSTLKDRYFASASATPASVFPRLLRVHQHHIDKLDGGRRVNREKLIAEICSHISRFPPHMSLEKQGLFYIAYYHQRQDFFTKKDTSAQSETTKETNDE